MGSAFSLSHGAVLAAQLPKDSRVAISINPDLSWHSQDWFLRRITYDLEMLLYSMSNKGNKPQPVDEPSKAITINKKIEKTNYEYIAKALGVDYG